MPQGVLYHKTRDTAELVRSEAAICHKRHRFQPELDHLPITFYVDMRGFSTVRTEKDKAVGTDLKNSGHRALSLTTCMVPQFVYSIVCEKVGGSHSLTEHSYPGHPLAGVYCTHCAASLIIVDRVQEFDVKS